MLAQAVGMLCALALLSACADMLLPEGKLRDGVRFGMSLLALLAILTALAEALGGAL